MDGSKFTRARPAIIMAASLDAAATSRHACRCQPPLTTGACSSGPCRRAGPEEVGCDDRRRFELELEFLHCLANPGYLNCELHAGASWRTLLLTFDRMLWRPRAQRLCFGMFVWKSNSLPP